MFRKALDFLATGTMIVASVAVIWAVSQHSRGGGGVGPLDETDTPPPTPISLEGVALKGDLQAQVGMVMFSDFECPFCAKFVKETLPQIETEYVQTGKLRLAFRQMPGRSHKFAQGAATASLCAGEQGKFWEMHDLLFSGSDISTVGLTANSRSLGLEPVRYGDCITRDAIRKTIQLEASLGRTMGVTGTPGFIFGTIRDEKLLPSMSVSGAQPLASFERVLNDLMAESPPKK